MKSFQVELPPCDVEKVGFWGDSARSDQRLALSFTAPKVCIDQFLKNYGVKVEDPKHWPFGAWANSVDGRKVSPTEPPFAEKEIKQFDWNLDPGRQYNFYRDFHTPSGADFDVLVDPRDTKQTVYMRSVFTNS